MIVPRFVGRVDTHQWQDWDVFDQALVYEGSVTVVVPAGFLTDWASIPRVLRTIFEPRDPRWSAAAAVHDRCYEQGKVSRMVADCLLYEAMSAEQPTGKPPVCAPIRRVFFHGVWLAGARSYRTGAERQRERLLAYAAFERRA